MVNFYEFLNVTEAGAIAALKWVGKGNKEAADEAASEAMRKVLNSIDLSMEVAIGEGLKDKSHGLYRGERLGLTSKLESPRCQIAIDPIEGTSPVAKDGKEALSVMAITDGEFFQTDRFYMSKLAFGAKIYSRLGKVSLKYPIANLIPRASRAQEKPISEFTVCVLDRPRHKQLIQELRTTGCKVKLIQDCDVTACLDTCLQKSGIDMYLGVGGATEAVLTATALRDLGYFVAAVTDDKGEEIEGEELTADKLVTGNAAFIATGITDGSLLSKPEVETTSAARSVITESILIYDRTVQWITKNSIEIYESLNCD